MQFDPRSGWCQGVSHCPSPNFNARPEGEVVSLLVIHNISLPPGQFGTGKVQCFFQNRLDADEHPYFADIAQMTVSAHFLIERDGSVFQFVSCNDRAWHAGVSRFDGRENCNDFSIGIELEGTDDEPYSDAQYAALAELGRQLLRAYPAITPGRIQGHSDIAPGRKTDPGPAFDWQRFLAALCKEST
ncbi:MULTISPECIES: 1,6-anhydro-N-acetylmuramyl-L-alanine amidase AmpD [Pseudomonas]|uniref:1,6-anhydro-N-acetylmuramyl-L-alanine amidase AmpD n=1 Tax=Pseudomonas TaxID=286 RepID=UPI0004D9DE97|nr:MULTISPECIES: 1,6-anhydro-N-acetylmuramyl-L-alanine amidase AmpD [Pseudomonas]KES21651.1 N-acetyl-anhydromuranmyl-L-alanine amidase [Pseudomonas sp. AAC]KRV66972.1 N-acetyl-anhydromuranmyl-L-alanine amidase [Pseudomonas citronellolis]KRW78111.1 N-acetyl-anhydromuranmyl-L-alanine amidase [Pseudomonas citronellolis]OHS04393.1 N-acetyl-anhydromuranmyl-L-alanine amidase [Pseudomonas sp. HMSC75E02]